MKVPTLLFLLPALALSAQETPGGNRMGIGLYGLAPAGSLASDFGTGFQGGLQIHFNRESRHLGRLRIDYLKMDSRHPVVTAFSGYWNGSSYIPSPEYGQSRMEAYSVSYEWMPHVEHHSHSGLFGIFGVGGTLWNEQLKPAAGPYGSYTEDEVGLTLSAGAGWRFNPHAAAELRVVHCRLEFGGHHNYGAIRSYVAFGTSLRF